MGCSLARLTFPSGSAAPVRLQELDAAIEKAMASSGCTSRPPPRPPSTGLSAAAICPEPIREDLLETDERTRLERLGDTVLGVIGGTVAWADPSPWRLCTLRTFSGGTSS